MATVIEDDVKFSLALGVPIKKGSVFLQSTLIGAIAGLALGITSYAIQVSGAKRAWEAYQESQKITHATGIGDFFERLGNKLGNATGLVRPDIPEVSIGGPLFLGIFIMFVTTLVIYLYRRFRKIMTYGGLKAFSTPLEALGIEVSNMVFVPAIGMAKLSGGNSANELSIVMDEMTTWGYSQRYIEAFTNEVLKKEMKTINGLISGYIPRVKKGDIDHSSLKDKSIDLCKRVQVEAGIVDENKVKYLEYIRQVFPAR